MPVLAAGLRATRAARQALQSAAGTADARADVDFVLARKEADFAEALAQAAGIVVDPLSDEETVVPGGSIDVSVRTFLEHADLATVTNGRPERAGRDGGWRPSQAGGHAGGFRREIADRHQRGIA